jgi:hypothetical protein
MVGARIATLKTGQRPSAIAVGATQGETASLNVPRSLMERHTIRALRAGHHDTVEVPVLSMAELVESRP